MNKTRLLILEDDEVTRTQLRRALDGEHDFAVPEERSTALELVTTIRPHAVLLGLPAVPFESGDGNGLRLLGEILDLDPLTRVVVIADLEKYPTAIEAVEMGAVDYCLKPLDIDELRVIVRRAVRLRVMDAGPSRTQPAPRALRGEDGFPDMLGSSGQMLSVFSTIDRAARSDVTVLITGESGTGKELAARAIHDKSTRNRAPFVPISCVAIPETLIESELFGHEKGAFTGAHVARKGRLERADGGTIFLDEISELPLSLQVKLLRFLQEREVERIGGRERIPLNVRIIAASNTDLKRAIANGSFREDLYYRLAVVVIAMPPLRERGEDSVLLAHSFLQRISRELGHQSKRFNHVSKEAIREYSWPGNIRELENKVKRAIIMAKERIITPADLDLMWPPAEGRMTSLREAREEAERRIIVKALQRNRGNISRAASEISVSRPTLHGLLVKHNLHPRQFRQS